MSMIGNLLRVTNSELEDYLKDSSLLESRIYSDGNLADPNYIDIGKTWDALFYLLTGFTTSEMEKAQPPLSWVLFNEQTIDAEQDLGYSPGYYSTSEQVKEIARALSNISSDILKQKFDGHKLMELKIYPEIWMEDETVITYLTENFERLKKFYMEASQNNQAVITFIN